MRGETAAAGTDPAVVEGGIPDAPAPASASADEAFEQLAALYARLPAMQEKGRELRAAREARALRGLRAHLDALEREWERLDSECRRLMAEEHALREDARPDDGALGLVRARIRHVAETVALRRAPLAQAREALAEALAQGSLSLDDPLDALALPDGDFDALERDVTVYQEAYALAYGQCKGVETP
ncbi:MAG: hypothetical protein LBL86_00030 [Coriobacteriales bacterium]|nr:hypothetical protein [Coriobacteriales bacterium]